ncbi:hypothetical protein C6P40_000992 [Pichia californica]|uniref:Uncharacterized protein n=1 Tax=Pichia californica TaxID=460514 RepID=A0A9P6WJW3_9ASCO|nr:hypothetical protein C6P42_000985 [[Candida] californica]KAG0688435.1 hypothetical protein C6P40_000992 [[Candida] californica]
MEGTPISSTTQLTDPPLYSIFGGRNNIYSENQETDDNDKIDLLSSHSPSSPLSKENENESFNSISLFLINIFKTSIFATSIFYMFQSVHSSNPLTIPKYSTFQWYTNNNDLTIFNIILTSIILDGIINLLLNKLNNHNSNKNHNNSTILQLSIAILGIIFGFKKINWNSTTEANFVFLLVNFFFTRYLGCSIKENLIGIIISFSSYVYDFHSAENSNIQIIIWRCLFSFFLTITLIKLRKSNTFF